MRKQLGVHVRLASGSGPTVQEPTFQIRPYGLLTDVSKTRRAAAPAIANVTRIETLCLQRKWVMLECHFEGAPPDGTSIRSVTTTADGGDTIFAATAAASVSATRGPPTIDITAGIYIHAHVPNNIWKIWRLLGT
jgi:hypothetical protein